MWKFPESKHFHIQYITVIHKKIMIKRLTTNGFNSKTHCEIIHVFKVHNLYREVRLKLKKYG